MIAFRVQSVEEAVREAVQREREACVRAAQAAAMRFRELAGDPEREDEADDNAAAAHGAEEAAKRIAARGGA